MAHLLDRFDQLSVDGYELYVQQHLDYLSDEIKIRYVKAIFFEQLVVDGVA